MPNPSHTPLERLRRFRESQEFQAARTRAPLPVGGRVLAPQVASLRPQIQNRFGPQRAALAQTLRGVAAQRVAARLPTAAAQFPGGGGLLGSRFRNLGPRVFSTRRFELGRRPGGRRGFGGFA